MRKVILFLMVAFAIGSAVTASAQGQGGGREKMQEMLRSRLKDSLHFSDVKIDTVMAVQKDYFPQQRQIMTDNSLSQADKKTKWDALKKEMHQRYKAAGFTEDEIQKLNDVEQRIREGMRNKMNKTDSQ